MSLRHFGIFLAYGPTVDLQKEGLGRLLVAFLKAAATRQDVRFVIACPQWSRKSLLALLESEGIAASSFDVVSTDGVPLILRIVLARSRKRIPRRPSRLTRLLKGIQSGVVRHRQQMERRLVATRSATHLVCFYRVCVNAGNFTFTTSSRRLAAPRSVPGLFAGGKSVRQGRLE